CAVFRTGRNSFPALAGGPPATGPRCTAGASYADGESPESSPRHLHDADRPRVGRGKIERIAFPSDSGGGGGVQPGRSAAESGSTGVQPGSCGVGKTRAV